MSQPIKIEHFPQDDQYWFVKWIDEFSIPHLQTISTSVKVLLQKLPIQSASEISNLNTETVKELLGQRSTEDPEPEVLKRHAVILAGYLPCLHIGAIFLNQEHVGNLPTDKRTILVPSGEVGTTEHTLGELLPPPHGWTYHYRLLNRSEYSAVFPLMKHSRCLVVERNNVSYIFPRMTVFKAFYAFHTVFSNAFCHGSWVETCHTILSVNDLPSGQKSEITSEGKWNIVLQKNVKDDYACWAALYYLDEYARARANEIYSIHLRDRHHKSTSPHWYASAKFPFKEDKEPLHVGVRGFFLRNRGAYDLGKEGGPHSKFLVTEIVKLKWPDWIPTIVHGRVNDQSKADNPVPTDEPPPFCRKTILKKDEQHPQEIGSDVDPDQSTTSIIVSSAEMEFTVPPKYEPMKKERSKTYDDSPRPPPKSRRAGKLSMGEPGTKPDAADKGVAEIVVRDADKRFTQLLAALTKLQKTKKIQEVTIVSGLAAKRHGRRGDLDVWRFFYPPGTSGPIKLPPRSWRYFAQSKDEEGRRLREYRSALVLRIVADKQTHYWIEIESRNMEPGYRAIILGGIRSEHDQHIAGAMEIIASYQGRGMEGLSENLSVDKIKWGIYRHKYIKGTTPQALDSEHLLRFLGTYQT
jgi:hypothetical protein